MLVTVGDEAITTADVDARAARWAGASTGLLRLVPPNFTECVSALRRGGAQKQAPAPFLRRSCVFRFSLALNSLIERRWLEQEADRLGIQVDVEALRGALRAKRQEVVEDAAQAAGEVQQTPAAVRYDARTAQLRRQVRERLYARAGTVSDTEVDRYVRRYPNRFAVPAVRTVRLLSASGAAVRALRSGTDWRRYAVSIDGYRVTPHPGRTVFREDQGDDDLLREVFSTPPGRIGGPVRLLDRRLIFVVDRIEPRSRSQARMHRQARRFLRVQRETQIQRDFNLRHQHQTICHVEYHFDVGCRGS